MDDLLTTRQLQEILRVDRITIYRMLNDGRLSGFKVGGQWRFSAREVEAWLREQRAAPETVPSPPRAETPAPAASDALPLTCIAAIQGIYAEALQVAGAVTDVQGSPITSISNPCAFCELILSTGEGRRRCAADWRQVDGERPHHCHANLWCASLPIELAGETVAFAAACQFSTPTLDDQPERRERIARLAVELSIPVPALQTAASSVHRLSEEDVARIPQILRRVSQTMTEIGQERLKLVSRLRQIAQVSQV